MGLPPHNRTLLIPFSVLLITGISIPVLAEQHYEADIDTAEWSVKGSTVRCELSHSIPGFGIASFINSAGGELAFQLTADSPPVKDAEAMLYSSPPYWKPDVVARELVRSPLMKGKTPVYYTRNVAQRMVYELDKGMQPTILYRDWADASENVTVAVSTVRFRDAWPDFVKCQKQLLPFGYEEVKNTSMLFNSGSARLSSRAIETLNKVVRYVKNDASVKTIRLTGHTDSVGFRYLNFLLSDRRARAVRKYLISKGIPANKIKIRALGEGRPKVSNASLSGRSYNRRVQVELIR